MQPRKKRLTEEELKRWWPFERLEPERFPKPPKTKTVKQPPDWEDRALI